MADLNTRLFEILNRQVGARGIAGLAVAVRPGAQPETAWVPSSSLEEPALLAYSITKTLAAASSRALALDGSPRDVRAHYHPGWVSHGVVASTPSEIARFLDALFRGHFVSPQSLDEMTALVPLPESSAEDAEEEEPGRSWGQPSYGLGLMGDPASPWGVVWGHNGGGPGYSASAFHAPELGRVSVCAMAGSEDLQAEQLVLAVLDELSRTVDLAPGVHGSG